MRGQVSQPHNTTGNIIVLYVLTVLHRVFQNKYYRLLGVVLQVWFHEATLFFVAHSVPAQNRPGPIHKLSEGGMGGAAVHATTPYARVGEQQGRHMEPHF